MAHSIGKARELIGPERLLPGCVVTLSERTDALSAHAHLLPLAAMGRVVREIAGPRATGASA